LGQSGQPSLQALDQPLEGLGAAADQRLSMQHQRPNGDEEQKQNDHQRHGLEKLSFS
jgi:hypothetical protein